MPKKVIKQISKIYFDKLDAEGQDMFNVLYDEYEKQPIFTLREVARDMGLRSATTMQKASLIEKMVQTRLNNTLLRTGADDKKALNSLGETDDLLIDDYLQKTVVKNPIPIDGLVYLSSNGAHLRRRFASGPDDVYLPARIVNDYMLSTGDYITGKARQLTCGGQGLYAIETLNNRPAKKGGEQQIIKPVFHAPDTVVMLDGSPRVEAMSCLCPFYYGGRRLIISRGVQSLTALASQIILSFNKQGAKTAALFFDEQQDAEVLKLPGCVQSLTVEDTEKADDAASLAGEYIKKAAAAGQAAVILINNADILDEKTLRRIFGMPRFINDGSITVVLLSTALELDQKINRLTRLADSIIELDDCGGMGIKVK